jgi:hypothetical protein
MSEHQHSQVAEEEIEVAQAVAGQAAPASTAGAASAMGNHAFGQMLASFGGRQAISREASATSTIARAPTQAPVSQLSRAVLARRGQPIPAGAIPKPSPTNSVDGTKVTSKLSEMGKGIYRGFDGFQGTPLERQIINAFETANLQPRSIAINWTDERGLNKNWTGTVNIRMENPTKVGAEGSGKTTGAGGGSGTSGTATSTSNTTGASAEGSVEKGGHEGGTKAGGKVGGSTSNTTSQGESQGATGSGGTGSETFDKIQRYECTIVADIFLRLDMDVSGTDYINPFKWGFYGVEALTGPHEASDSVECGKWTYEVSMGFDPAGPPKG